MLNRPLTAITLSLTLAGLTAGCGKKEPADPPTPAAKMAPQPGASKKAAPKQAAPKTASPTAMVPAEEAPVPEGADPELFRATLVGLDALSQCRGAERIPMMRLTNCDAWKQLIRVASMDISGWQRDKDQGMRKLRSRADAAAVRLEADTEMERLGAQRLLELTLRTLQHTEAKERDRYRNALAARLKRTDDPKERQALLTFMANYPAPAVTDALIHILDGGGDERVKGLAALTLARCLPNRCSFDDKAKVERWQKDAKDPLLKGDIIQLAGAMDDHRILTWCEGHLIDDPLAHGCRAGLRRLSDQRAFDLLKAALDRQLAQPVEDEGRALDIAGRLADLTPFYSRPDVPAVWRALVQASFDKVEQWPHALQLVAEQLGLIPDQVKGRALLLKRYKTLRKRWTEPNKDQIAALSRVRQIITQLGGADQLDEFKESAMPLGPDGGSILPDPGGMMPPGVAPPPGMPMPGQGAHSGLPPGAPPPGGALPFPAPTPAPQGALPFPAPTSP